VRSDEWLVWTPSILAQCNHQPRWPVENPAVGAGKSPLIMSLPVRHYSMLFRPQLYGFFLLGTERGFSWYWNTKIFGLLAAMFLLFWQLSGGRFMLGLCGTALVFTAGYIQWFFSCPPMLPEMLSMWALALVCIITLSGRCALAKRVAATAGLIIGVINFALCCYPPFQIPLLYLAAAILCGWFWQRRGAGPVDTPSIPRAPVMISFGIAAVCICGVLVPFFIECAPTLHMVASTAYPGARRTHGGGVSFANLLRGIAAPLVSEQYYPKIADNVCEASGFFPFALPAVALLLIGLRGNWKNLKLILPSFFFLGFFALFSLLPMPQWLADVTGLSLTTTERWALPVGIANILVAVLFFPEVAKAPVKARLLAWIIAMVAVAGWIEVGGRAAPAFFVQWRIVALIAASAILFGSYVAGRAALFGVCSFCILAPAALSVNPITLGLGPLLDSPVAVTIRDIAKTDPTAGWAAYDNAYMSQFLMAQGLPVITGSKTVPDLRFYDEIDPGGSYRSIYDRYGFAVFQGTAAAERVGFKLINFCGYIVVIDPTNAALRRDGVRFHVFAHEVGTSKDMGIELVKAMPERRIWIYRNADSAGRGE
jgi:hypothetical protein